MARSFIVLTPCACLFVYFLPFGCVQVFFLVSFMPVYVVFLYQACVFIYFFLFFFSHTVMNIFIYFHISYGCMWLARLPLLLRIFCLILAIVRKTFASSLAAAVKDACVRPMLFNRLLWLCFKWLPRQAPAHVYPMFVLSVSKAAFESHYSTPLSPTPVSMHSGCRFVGNVFRLLYVFGLLTWWKTET